VFQKRSYKTPVTPSFKVNLPDQDSELIDPESQSRYCSRAGMILYSINYSRPDICNVVRELCKCMDGATIGTYFEMLRVIKFLPQRPKFENKIFNLNVFATVTGLEIQRQGLF
jgi:hypothetical protein